MQPDYPAAHSMDSVWFAVDADGNVATFYTGEDGHIPTHGNEGYGFDTLADLEAALGKTVNEDDDCAMRTLNLGLFNYDYASDLMHPVDPYDRDAVPDKPLHVDQLPANLRKRMRQVTFATLRFRDAKRIQPLEFYPCDAWDVDACAYLCADGKTVRPIPGEENVFPEFVEEFRREWPDVAARLIFDGPLEPPADMDEEG